MKFRQSNYLEIPHGNTSIWRYMSFEKFLDVATNSHLFFANATSFTDGYEIQLPKANVEAARRKLVKDGLTGRDLEEELGSFQYNNSSMKGLTLLNCWTIEKHENFALWKIYLGGAKAGVAIRSTVSRVRKAIELGRDSYSEEFFVGRVKYRSYIPLDELSRFALITTKNEYYKYENELRFFILHYPRSEGGVVPPYRMHIGRHVRIDIDALVEQIYLSPFVGAWFEPMLRKILKQFTPHLEERIVTSSISDQ